MVTPRVSNMAGICAQVPTPGLSCSLEWLCFRSSLVWCKNPKNNEFRTKKFPNQEFLYGISSFCTLSENNCFLHVKISCFCIFLAKNGVFNTNRTPRVVYGNPTLQDNNICALHIIGEVVHASGGESEDFGTQDGIGNVLHDPCGLAVTQCHIGA